MLGMILSIVMMAAPPEGTVVFFQSGFMAQPIQKATGSDMNHAAIILYNEGKPYVYESTKGGVQRTPFDEWIKQVDKRMTENKKVKVHFIEPKQPYSPDELRDMKNYANSQLGRRYMLRGYWKNREVRGLHCSQYVGNILERSGRYESSNWKESPGSLYDKLIAN